MGNPLAFFLFISIYFISCLPLLFWLTYFFEIKTFKMPTKIEYDATDSVMGLHDNVQEPGGINRNTDVTDADTDYDMGLNGDAVLIFFNY